MHTCMYVCKYMHVNGARCDFLSLSSCEIPTSELGMESGMQLALDHAISIGLRPAVSGRRTHHKTKPKTDAIFKIWEIKYETSQWL